MSGYETIQYDTTDRVATIRLDRPERRNAMSLAMIEEIVDALDAAETDDSLRAIVVTGNGDAFSAGWDLGETGGTTDDIPTVDSWLDRFEQSTKHLDRIYDHDLPVVAAVNGYAIAGGLALAAYADITVASQDATFSAQAIRMGGYSPTPILPYVTTSIKHVRELWYTGKSFDAAEAERIGIVNHAVAHDELMEKVAEITEMITKVPSTTVTMEKRMLNGMLETKGYSASRRAGEYLDAAAHSTEQGRTFFELRKEKGLKAAVDWMNNAEKD